MAEEENKGLSDVHISTQYHITNDCHVKVNAVSRFLFKLPENDVDNEGVISKGKEPINCKDADGDFIVRRKPVDNLTNQREVITIYHGLETELKDVGLQIWNGCLLMCDFILHGNLSWKNETILDLGAGVGLTSIVSAMFADKVYSTDTGNDVLDIARNNVEVNARLLRNGGQSVEVREIDWIKCDKENGIYTFTAEELEKINFVFAAEVIYDIDLTEAFFTTIEIILQKVPKTVYIALEKRLVFTLEDLDVVSPAYSHFQQCLTRLVNCHESNLLIEHSQIPCDFPQYFDYHRVKELELWEITSRVSSG
ncbi:hypothetical protein SNE40_019603 [Patella caerulea]